MRNHNLLRGNVFTTQNATARKKNDSDTDSDNNGSKVRISRMNSIFSGGVE